MTRLQMPADLLQRLVRIPPWTEPIRTIQEIRLKDRLQDQQCGHLHHSVSDRRNPQRPQLSVRLWDVYSPYRLRPVALRSQFLLQALHPSVQASLLLFNLLEGDSVQARGSVVAAHSRHRRFQYIQPIDPVIQRVKPKLRFLLGLLAELLSQLGEFPRPWAFALPVFRSGRFRQAALLSSDSAFFCRAPSLHGRYPASSLLRAHPSPSGPLTVIDSRFALVLHHPGGFPRFLDRSVLARCPQPPRRSDLMLAYCFSDRGRLHPARRTGRSHLVNEVESGSLALRLASSLARGFSFSGFPSGCSPASC